MLADVVRCCRFGLGSYPLTAAAAVAAAGWLGSSHSRAYTYWSAGKQPSHGGGVAAVYTPGATAAHDTAVARPVTASRHSYNLYQQYT